MSSQSPRIDVAVVLGVFLCAVFLSLFFSYLKIDIQIDLFFLFFVQYWLLGIWGIIFSFALFLTHLPTAQHIGILGISYLLFVITTSVSVYYMRHNFFVFLLMFFLGEMLFFLSYGFGAGLLPGQGFLIVRTVMVHGLLFIPLAVLSPRFLYEE